MQDLAYPGRKATDLAIWLSEARASQFQASSLDGFCFSLQNPESACVCSCSKDKLPSGREMDRSAHLA